MQALIPETAPFTEEQRAWLDGFIAGLLGAERARDEAMTASGTALDMAPSPQETMPWHDPTLGLEARMELAQGRSLELRLMAAMGQLDCGQCGYECRSYAAAIAASADADLGKCVPGGRATARKLKELMAQSGDVRPSAVAPVAPPPPRPAPERGYCRDAPVHARLLLSEQITGEAAEKETRHIVLELPEPDLRYMPGDSLGVWPENNPEEVELLIAILRAKGSEAVTLANGDVLSARTALSRACDLRMPAPQLYALLAGEARDDVDRSRLATLAENDEQADTFGVHDVLDLLLEFPSARPRIDQFVGALGRMQPRLYSIASSQRKHPRQVHLTIGVLRYEKNERAYRGTASSFLSDYLRPGRRVSVFVQRAHAFRLPSDPCAPVIMVGPGTGIAPFRSFLQEREAFGAPGRNWLFFGNPRRETDFLYRAELEELALKRVLTRMDLAFSRDQMNKVYVQHKMLEAAPEFWRWLGGGAHLYVCGDAKRMAGDVDLALQQIAVTQGGMDVATAKRYVADLAREGRYQRDVY